MNDADYAAALTDELHELQRELDEARHERQRGRKFMEHLHAEQTSLNLQKEQRVRRNDMLQMLAILQQQVEQKQHEKFQALHELSECRNRLDDILVQHGLADEYSDDDDDDDTQTDDDDDRDDLSTDDSAPSDELMDHLPAPSAGGDWRRPNAVALRRGVTRGRPGRRRPPPPPSRTLSHPSPPDRVISRPPAATMGTNNMFQLQQMPMVPLQLDGTVPPSPQKQQKAQCLPMPAFLRHSDPGITILVATSSADANGATTAAAAALTRLPPPLRSNSCRPPATTASPPTTTSTTTTTTATAAANNKPPSALKRVPKYSSSESNLGPAAAAAFATIESTIKK